MRVLPASLMLLPRCGIALPIPPFWSALTFSALLFCGAQRQRQQNVSAAEEGQRAGARPRAAPNAAAAAPLQLRHTARAMPASTSRAAHTLPFGRRASLLAAAAAAHIYSSQNMRVRALPLHLLSLCAVAAWAHVHALAQSAMRPLSPEDPCARRRRGLLQSLSLAPPSGMRIRAAAAVAVAHLSLCRRLLSLGCIRARARSARFAPFRTPVYRATRDADLALSSCLCAHGLPSSGSSLGPTTRWRAR